VDYKDFCNIGFSSGMGIIIRGFPDVKRSLVAIDFETGDCEDAYGSIWGIDSIDHFFYFDGSPVKGQK
jgi:hypothetical protein